MPKIGICPVCDKGPKKIPYLHPDGTGQNICHACYQKNRRKQKSKLATPEGISEPARKTSPVVPVSSIPAELIAPPSRPVYRPISMKVTEPERKEEDVSQSDCCWVVDTANNRDLEGIKRLNEMIEQGPEKVRGLLKEIFRPSYPVAQAIVRKFLKTAEGEKLKSFIAQDPDLKKKVGVLYFFKL